MKIYNSNDREFHISNGLIKEIEEYVGCFDEELNMNLILDDFVKGNIEEYVNSYSKLTGLKGFGLLHAHGVGDKVGWFYNADEKPQSVQSWINEMDGKYNALVIAVCNPNSRGVHSKKSLIIAPNETYSGMRQDLGDVQVELFVPKLGYLDGYIFEDEIEDLKRRIR